MPADPLVKLIHELEASRDEADEKTLRALATVIEFYRGAFERVIEVLEQNGQSALAERMLEDPLLASILRGYGLLESDIEKKVNAALDSVRPFLQSHDGGVTLIAVANNTAYLQLAGSCHGCSASMITLKAVIEKAIQDRVPELDAIEVAGLTDSPPEDSHRWVPLLHAFQLQNLPAGEFFKVRLFDEEVLVSLADRHVFAFKNRCPAGQESLETATQNGLFITCGCHGHRFDLRNGRHTENAGLRLEVLPVQLSGDLVKVGL